jgi:hypothetical protein
MRYILFSLLISAQCFSQNNTTILDKETSHEIQLALKAYQLNNWMSNITDSNENFKLWIVNYNDMHFFSNCNYILNPEILDTIHYHKHIFYLVSIKYDENIIKCNNVSLVTVKSHNAHRGLKQCLVGIDSLNSNIIYISGDFITHNAIRLLSEIEEIDINRYVQLTLYKFDLQEIRLVGEKNGKLIFESFSNLLNQTLKITVDKKSGQVAYEFMHHNTRQ